MTPQEAITKLKELQNELVADTEYAHMEADNVLCSFLESIGQKEIVEEFRKVNKWYV